MHKLDQQILNLVRLTFVTFYINFSLDTYVSLHYSIGFCKCVGSFSN